jgi:glycosyltransferase involved in cell wall biosynthesis
MFYDIIFIQKVVTPTFVIKLFVRTFKKKIVFDFDDAIFIPGFPYSKTKLDRQIQLSDLIIIENLYNQEYVNKQGNNDTLIITGPIDCNRYHPAEKDSTKQEIVIGWIGSPAAQQFLDMLENVFTRLSSSYKNIIFRLIGGNKRDFYAAPCFGVRKWSLRTEVLDLQDFDIGIMSLPDNEETKGKGGYKLLQYMATGIPCVASPVGVNSELIIDGVNGFLAISEEEWHEKLLRLIKDKDLRKKMGQAGRRSVVENYSLEVAYPKLRAALMRLCPCKETG